jgi:AhpC/TSA family protein
MRRIAPFVLVLAGCIETKNPNTGDVGGPDCDGSDGYDVGNRFAGFEFTACDGSATVTEADVPDGNALLFNVSAGWCQPCIAETPGFETYFAEHESDGLSIVQVLYEDENNQSVGPTFCDRWTNGFDGQFPEPLTYTVLLDPARALQGMFDVVNLPVNIAVDRSGCVVGNWVGVPPSGEPESTLSDAL